MAFLADFVGLNMTLTVQSGGGQAADTLVGDVRSLTGLALAPGMVKWGAQVAKPAHSRHERRPLSTGAGARRRFTGVRLSNSRGALAAAGGRAPRKERQ
jgi:hypothetical protein